MTQPPSTPMLPSRALATQRETKPPLVRRLVGRVSPIAGPLVGLVLVILIFGSWKPTLFFSSRVFVNVLSNNYHFAVAAVGATFVIITAGIDLSVGSTMALACVCCAMTIKGFATPEFEIGQGVVIGGGIALLAALSIGGRMRQRGEKHWRTTGVSCAMGAIAGLLALGSWFLVAGHRVGPQPVVLGIVVGIFVGAVVGWVNGLLVTSLALPPFIVTLATLEAVRGTALYVTNAIPVSSLPGDLKLAHYGSWLGLPPNVWLTGIVLLIAIPILHYTVLGRYAYAIGSSERTARLCGVRVERWKTVCYVIGGICAGIAGVMMAAKFNGGPPDEFRGSELTVIAAVVIGGTSLFGGEGTVLGVLMLGFLYTGCNIADISPHVQRIFIGATIVLAAAVDRFRHLGR
jgi:ribose/xylose/arabinose/galactoside ABC-type transport system permease subunit